MYHYPLLRHPRPAPPRVVILPPSSSSSTASDFSSASTVSSALSSAATVDSTRSKNAQLRARFFEQRAQEGGEEKAADEQRTEQTTPSGRPSTSPRVRSARIPPPPLPEQHTPFAAVQQGQRPWWRDRHEQQRENGEEGKWGWTTGRWWGGLKGRREEEKGATENSSPSPSRQKPKFVYTSSRKSNKEARMEQGPREYESCKDIGIDFCARTSSHGIPFVGTHSFFGRPFWALVTTIAFCSFIIQTYFTLSDYIEYRTIIEMQLKFEPAPFPAATICNLNAFKLSEVRKFEEIEQGIKHWEKAISTLNRLKEATGTRRRRQVVYRPVYVRCVCRMPDDQCTPQRNLMDRNASVCLCYEDADTGDIWPCYLYTVWKEKKCSHCSNSNTCDDPDKPPNITSLVTKPRDPPVTCLCQPISHYCLLLEPNSEIHWWNPHNYSVYPSTVRPPISDVEQAFGLEDLKDRGAITTKTKENVIFLVAGMSREVRQSLSYTLDEFVLRCSFNSKDCDLQRDFQIQIDPEYGNCWTFNFNDSVELKNSRAGPMYGLRLLLNVNQSDYMPTTEAAGVRIVVHEQDQEPFPDTFGYSAPTGFVSSFGLKTKILNRLDAPYGKCSDTFRPEGYIYAEHYSPEGCYRNCFQHSILERCGCGDPRFPLPNENEDRACDARNPRERTCLAEQTSVLGGFHHLTHDCLCVQPCTEHVFETAYSAAAWPALNFNIGGDDCSLVLGPNFTLEECTEYYRQNTALIEIYYEQLNYEKLKETPGYTLVNLFSDLGGNIGLWIGFSLITVMEVVELIFECLTFGLKNCVYRPLRKKAMNRRASHADDALLRHQSSVSTSHQSVAFSEGPGREPGGGGGHPPLVRRVSGRSSTQRRGYVRPPLRKWRSNVPTSIDEKPGDESADRNASVQHGEQYTYTYTFGPGGSDAGGGASTAVGRTPERAGSGSAKVQFAQHK